VTIKDDGHFETDYASHHFNHMPPLKLANEEMFTSRGLLSPSDELPPRITVSNLTASWTNVSMLSYFVCIIRVFIGEGKAGIEQC